MSWGPWSPTCLGHDRRVLLLRTLRAITYMRLGPHHPLIEKLHKAETDAMAFVEAQQLFETVPTLRRRQIQATFAAITWPPK